MGFGNLLGAKAGGGGGGGLSALMKSAGSAIIRCRRDLRVAAMLQEWWELSQEAMRMAGKPSSGLDKDTYFLLFNKIYKAMVSEYDSDEAEDAVLADWDVDSRGEGIVPEESFKSVMFELAQTWTPGSKPDKYASFLRDLLNAITEIDESTGPERTRVLKRDLDDMFDVPVWRLGTKSSSSFQGGCALHSSKQLGRHVRCNAG